MRLIVSGLTLVAAAALGVAISSAGRGTTEPAARAVVAPNPVAGMPRLSADPPVPAFLLERGVPAHHVRARPPHRRARPAVRHPSPRAPPPPPPPRPVAALAHPIAVAPTPAPVVVVARPAPVAAPSPAPVVVPHPVAPAPAPKPAPKPAAPPVVLDDSG